MPTNEVLKAVPHRNFFYYKGARKTLLLRIKLEDENLNGYYNLATNRFIRLNHILERDEVKRLDRYEVSKDFDKGIGHVDLVVDEIISQIKKRRIKDEVL